LVVYPHYNSPDASTWTKLWNAIQYRNVWIAASAYAEKTPCVDEARRAREFALQELRKKPTDLSYLGENRAKAEALCVPAEALDIFPFRVKASSWFGAL
jgi:hypothetical protein